MAAFLDGVACTPGRGGHSGAVEAARLAFRCRRALSQALGLPGDPGRIAFMHNATHALNTALWGLLGPGDVLVISQYDHNAVLRPAHHLSRNRGVEVRMLSGSPDGGVDLDEAATLLDGATVLVANAASNVLGTLLPMRELSRIAHDAGAVVVADVAQSAGHSAASPATQGADVVAFTGHKGLLGPQGTGGLWVREGIEVDPFLSGGTGGDSRNREMPSLMPDRLEAGTGNSPGMAGLLAGCAFLRDNGVGAIHRREMALKARLRDGLDCIPGLQVLSPPGRQGVPVVTVKADGMDSGRPGGPSGFRARHPDARGTALCSRGTPGPRHHRIGSGAVLARVGLHAGGRGRGHRRCGGAAEAGIRPGCANGMRLFFAVWPPEALRIRLWRALAPLREAAPDVRWVPPERYHITLRFLGDVAPPVVPRVTAAAETLAREPVFPARLTRTGTFPRRGVPRVYWVGVRSGPLQPLRRRLDEALARRGVRGGDDRFSPHLTIGRSRGRRRGSVRSGRRHPDPELRETCSDFVVDAVHLVRSELFPTGPRYANIHCVELSTSQRGAD